ncbi:hypothetical protein L195_g063084, partial [Trifolium pratense]
MKSLAYLAARSISLLVCNGNDYETAMSRSSDRGCKHNLKKAKKQGPNVADRTRSR